MEWEDILTNTSDKGLISKIYKELTKLNTKNKQTSNPIKEMVKGPEEILLQRDIQMVNSHMKRYSASLIIREKCFLVAP